MRKNWLALSTQCPRSSRQRHSGGCLNNCPSQNRDWPKHVILVTAVWPSRHRRVILHLRPPPAMSLPALQCTTINRLRCKSVVPLCGGNTLPHKRCQQRQHLLEDIATSTSRHQNPARRTQFRTSRMSRTS
jgi:hypothetical protein